MKQKHFTKSFGITAGVLIPLCIIVVGGYFVINFVKKSKEPKPWKPENEIYSLGEEINYGPATLKIIDFGVRKVQSEPFITYEQAFGNEPTKESPKVDMTVIKLKIKNSPTNQNSIVLNDNQFIIRDNDKIIETIIFDDVSLKPSARNVGHIYSGDERIGYLFFKETEFKNPILEARLFTGSYPIKIKLY